MPHCPFCNIRRQRIFKKNEHALAIEDKMLAGVEHLLIAPKRHVDSFFTMHKPEQEALLSLIGECCESLGEKCAPQDYFVGVKECDLDEGDSPQPIEGVTWLDADHGRIAVEEVYIA